MALPAARIVMAEQLTANAGVEAGVNAASSM
jgi:hypothetical protein